MICKICGCEMINNGDWFACPTCGSVHFGPDTQDEVSTAKEPEVPEKKVSGETPKPVSKAATQDDFSFVLRKEKKSEPTVKKVEPPVKKAEPVTKFTEPSVTKEESVERFTKPPVKQEEPIVKLTEPPVEKAEVSEEDGIYFAKTFSKNGVKSNSFTDVRSTGHEDFRSLSNSKDTFDDGNYPIKPDREDLEERPKSDRRKGKKSKDKKKSKLKDIVDFMFPIVAAVIIAFVLKTFIIANAKVPTGSMIATINIEDRIIASRLAYRTDSPLRYDIVLFYYPVNEEEIYVKRVLGLPGETLSVVDGVVYVTTKDGKTIETEHNFVNPAETPKGNYGPYYIPEKGETISVEGDYCYAENGMMMGNTDFLDKYCEKDEYGNYVIKDNLYFMMGDNRNYSSDSREWKFPYVSEEKIIGKVLFKYYPSFEKIE